jgi:hypothetical protein
VAAVVKGIGVRRKSQITYTKPWWWWDPWGQDWCLWAVYQPRGAASLADSLIDLSGNGNDAAIGKAPSWDAVNGWGFDGNTTYLTTAFTPDIDQSQSVVVRYSGFTSNHDEVLFGGYIDWYLNIRANSNGTEVSYGNGAEAAQAPGLAAGNLAVAGDQGYRNGAADGGTIAPAGEGACAPIYIGANNNNGVADSFAEVYIQALVIFDCTLPADEMAALVGWMDLL